MRQNQERYSLARRYFFPYSGEEVLTRVQYIRVMVIWALSFALALLIGVLPVMLALNIKSVQMLAVLLLMVFCIGAVVFGFFAWFIVFMNNQSAQIIQKQKEKKAAGMSSNSGGRYGS